MKCHRYGKESHNKNEEEEAIQGSMQVVEETRDANGEEKEKRNTNVQIRTNCPVVMVVRE
jgi:hypothetical protein